MRIVSLALAATLLTGFGMAAADTVKSPYVGLQHRPTKALSQEEISSLRAGRGMSQALAAELNGHPGPRHVLDLADRMELTAAQRAHTQNIFDAMQARSSALGREVLVLEAKLDEQFRAQEPDADAIEAVTVEIGRLRGALRAAHLLAHLQMDAILSPEQRYRYAELRGYNAAQSSHNGGGKGHSGDKH